MNIHKYCLIAIMLAFCVACSQTRYVQSGGVSVAKTSLLHTAKYSSELAAVESATNEFNPISIDEDREFMGAILRRQISEYTAEYSYTIARGNRGEDSINMNVAIPDGTEVVAFWHTHGAAHFSRKYFSDTDSNLVRQFGVPFYLADYTGTLRILKPGDFNMTIIQANRLGLGAQSGFAKGKPVHRHDNQQVLIVTNRSDSLG
jgi:hypothetical protein